MLNALNRLLALVFPPRPPADLVWLTPQLAQSSRFVSRDAPALSHLDIGAVLDLRAGKRHGLAPLGKARLHYMHLPIADGDASSEEQLSRAADWVLQEVSEDRKVLVHCSPAQDGALAALGALLLRMGYSLPDAVALLGQSCPQAALSEADAGFLQRYVDSLAD